MLVLPGFSIPGWCWIFQLKRLVEHYWVLGQGNLGSEGLGPGDLCGHAGALVKLLEMLEVTFQSCGGPAVPLLGSCGYLGVYKWQRCGEDRS